MWEITGGMPVIVIETWPAIRSVTEGPVPL